MTTNRRNSKKHTKTNPQNSRKNTGQRKVTANRKHKDRFFRFLFQDPKDLLELYNAINSTNHQNQDELTINTLDDVLYLGMKNDVSFIIDTNMNLYEHQSTWNPNMPLRGVCYFARLYEAYLQDHGYDIYGSRLIPLPVPSYLVFYNGSKSEPERSTLLLSDSFQFPGHIGNQKQTYPTNEDALFKLPALECRAIVININRGCNPELMKRCRRLWEYSEFTEEIRQNLKKRMTLDDAINTAIQYCLAHDILVDVLKKFRSEVFNMILTEYDEKATMKYLQNEAWEMGLEAGRAAGLKEGRAAGFEEGRENGIRIFIEDYTEEGFSKEVIISKLQRRFLLSEEQARETYQKNVPYPET